jgi:hypothetical protein
MNTHHRKNAAALWNVDDPFLHEDIGRTAQKLLSSELNGSRNSFQKTGKGSQQSAFAGGIGSDNGNKILFVYCQFKVEKDLNIAVKNVQSVNLEQ